MFAQPELLALGGSGPFVINLSVSTAPISHTARLTRAEHGAQIYQIKVLEDGRNRYRLRLGPFTHEHEADAALPAVRDDYPGALTATAGPADLQIFESQQAAIAAAEAAAVKETVLAEPEPPALAEVPILELEIELQVAPPMAAPAPLAPPPVRAVPVTLLPPQQQIAAVRAIPAASTVRAVTPPVIEPRAESVPVVDSTQTVRALTPTELNDRTSSPSFVIQLLLAEQAPDPDAVPNLDIFTEYRLYAVAGRDQGVVKHALRLGFFADEAAAKMVAAYLAEYYDNPIVVRVSGAEKERFAERRVEARKDVGATGRHASIEITGDLVARRRITAPA